jgi:hypothetical protein
MTKVYWVVMSQKGSKKKWNLVSGHSTRLEAEERAEFLALLVASWVKSKTKYRVRKALVL